MLSFVLFNSMICFGVLAVIFFNLCKFEFFKFAHFYILNILKILIF
jgi:hypothetical protein